MIPQKELRLRDDLVEDGLSVPIHFLDVDYEMDSPYLQFLDHSPSLKVESVVLSDEELNDEGMNLIIKITEPQFGWKRRKAYAYSADFENNI